MDRLLDRSRRTFTASAITAIETRAVGKSIATQLQASRVLLVKLLDACGASDPGLITRQGIPTAATWSEQRRSAIEAWAQLWKISWALAPPPPRPDNGG